MSATCAVLACCCSISPTSYTHTHTPTHIHTYTHTHTHTHTHPHTHTHTHPHPHTHRGSVLSVAVGASGDICFSGSTDTTIRVWQLPSDLGDPFDVYGKIISFFHVLCALLLTSTHAHTHRPRGSSRSSSGTHRCNMGSYGPLQWPVAVLWRRWNVPAVEPSAHEPASATLPYRARYKILV